MLIHNVVMVLLLAGNDGSTTLGVIPYKSYESCYASLKFPINPAMYAHVDRVCMSGKAFDNVVVLNQDKVLKQKLKDLKLNNGWQN